MTPPGGGFAALGDDFPGPHDDSQAPGDAAHVAPTACLLLKDYPRSLAAFHSFAPVGAPD